MGRGRPRFPPDVTCPAVLTIWAHSPAAAVAYGTLTPCGDPFQRSSAHGCWSLRGGCRPLQPTRSTPHRHRRQAMPPVGFGLLPVRSPLLRESSLFLGVLRCFSSPGALFGIAPKVPGRAPGGLPHSEIPGSLAASASPGHFAAWPRPSSAANAKASTMRPSCGFLQLCSIQHLSLHAIGPARARGTCHSGRGTCPRLRPSIAGMGPVRTLRSASPPVVET